MPDVVGEGGWSDGVEDDDGEDMLAMIVLRKCHCDCGCDWEGYDECAASESAW